LFYCALVSFIVIALNWEYVVSWGIVLLAGACALLFSVGLGLLAGSFCENKQQLMVWSFLPAQVLLIPVFLTGMEPILPDALRSVIPWIPTVAQAILFRYAFSDGAIPSQVLMHLGVALGGAILTLALVALRIGRSDR
jgi:ABC-type polysaccharide/polyol phosphate export permease